MYRRPIQTYSTGTSTPPGLPLELKYLIIDALLDILPPHPSSTEMALFNAALYACALTCTAWTHRASGHLYRNLHINIDRIDQLVTSLRASPQNGLLARSLTVDGDNTVKKNRLSLLPLHLPSLTPHLTRLRFFGVDLRRGRVAGGSVAIGG